MHKIFGAIIAWALSAAIGFCGPISTYPTAPAPIQSGDKIVGTRGTTQYNFTPDEFSAYTTAGGTTLGPYSGQVAQPLSGAPPQPCLSIFSYLTPAQQATIQSGKTSTVDMTAVLNSAIAGLTVNPAVGGIYNGTNVICFPPGWYNFTGTVDLYKTVRIVGAGNGMSDGQATILKFPANTAGFVIHSPLETSPCCGPGGDGSSLENVAILGGGGTNTSANGVWMRARGLMRDYTIGNFPGNEVQVLASISGGPTQVGNANGWRLDNGFIWGCDFTNCSTIVGQNGLYVAGSDANAGMTSNLDIINVRGYCDWDVAFLGNTHVQEQCSGGGLGATTTRSGTQYYLSPLATGAQGVANDPATSPSIWIPTSGLITPPAWPQASYVNGGAYRLDGNSALGLGLYSEGGQPPSFVTQNNAMIGGAASAVCCADPLSTGSVMTSTSDGFVNSVKGVGVHYVKWLGSTQVATVKVGGDKANGDLLNFLAPNWSSGWRFRDTGNDLIADYANSASYLMMTGPNTTQTFGRTATFPYAMGFGNFLICQGATIIGFNCRAMNNGAASPTTTGHAVGEIVWNRAAAVGQPMGWIETTQGSPDTWTALPTITGQAGVSCTAGTVNATTMVVVNGVVTHC